MAGNKNSDNRGLASADAKTRERVARAGGKAFHQKRGANGTDHKGQES
jgi:hypothetical protein